MMNSEAKFFDSVRAGILGPTLSAGEVEGCSNILKAMAGTPIAFVAYALATAYHETNSTMQPVREAYWLSEDWRKKNLRYWPWYGRGYVQLTWEGNYVKADEELTQAGLIKAGELVGNPDLAMRPDIAAFILRRGMTEGWFSGDKKGRHTLARYLPAKGPATLAQFTAARPIINLHDKDLIIARAAMLFQAAATAGGWA